MTLSRDRGYIYFECDGPRCAEVHETHLQDFDAARKDLAEAGWKSRNEGTYTRPDWKHYCPDEDRDGIGI